MEELECRTCSVRETAQVLGLNLGGIYGAIYRDEIPALRFGQRIVMPKDALHQLLENSSMVRQLSTPPPRGSVTDSSRA